MVKKILKVKTDYGTYDCIFEPAKDVSGYVVEARGVKGGAFTQGRTLAEAKRMIREAIEGMIEAHIIIQAEKEGVVKINYKQHSRIS